MICAAPHCTAEIHRSPQARYCSPDCARDVSRAREREAHRIALQGVRNPLPPKPCHCESPVAGFDVDGEPTCVYCGRTPVAA